MIKKLFRHNTYLRQSSTGTGIKLSILDKLKRVFKTGGKLYFSQTGEDQIINYYMEEVFKVKTGFYVDIGCYHPVQLSNTYFFYLKGWNGICIDLNTNLKDIWNKKRPNDIFLNEVISDSNEEVEIYHFEPQAVTTIDKHFLEEWSKHYTHVETRKTKTKRLDQILEEHNKNNKPIDFMTIDVEGHELNVLQSLSINQIRPKLIITESHDSKPEAKNKLYDFLAENNFRLLGEITVNSYWGDNELLSQITK
ncbi:MAG: hypothetical protein C0594_00755 [Marinilabiliales bacterium]|nr:MAG: hypothetical protein C0594_00755 [Marinilabiliales bacterium]